MRYVLYKPLSYALRIPETKTLRGAWCQHTVLDFERIVFIAEVTLGYLWGLELCYAQINWKLWERNSTSRIYQSELEPHCIHLCGSPSRICPGSALRLFHSKMWNAVAFTVYFHAVVLLAQIPYCLKALLMHVCCRLGFSHNRGSHLKVFKCMHNLWYDSGKLRWLQPCISQALSSVSCTTYCWKSSCSAGWNGQGSKKRCVTAGCEQGRGCLLLLTLLFQ